MLDTKMSSSKDAPVKDDRAMTIGGGSIGRKSATSGGGAKMSAFAAHAAKLDREEMVKPKELDPDCRKAMIAARVERKLTQVQLNTACSFPTNTINQIENGKMQPTPLQMASISRVLGITMKYM